MTRSPSIDTQPHQRNRKRASTDTAYYKSIDTEVNRAREGDYSIGSWEDEHHHESFTVETTIYAPGENKLQDGFTDEELLNMKRRDETYQIRAKSAWERIRFSHPIDRAIRPSIDTRRPQSIDINNTMLIDNHPIPKTTVSEKDKFDNQYLTPDEFANGADNLFMHQRNNPEQKATKESYDTVGGVNKGFIQRSRHTTQPSIDVDIPTSVDRQPEFGIRAFDFHGTRRFYWEEKNEYGVYRDDRRYTRDLDGHTIPVHNKDSRRLLEKASRDEPAYICLPEHASLFTQTKLVQEIYTNDEINEMFYGVCGEQEKNKEAFQIKLDGVYYSLNDSISWLTTCIEEKTQDIARIQHATDFLNLH
ncbi:hypothetical protein F2Q69_00005954 [Brassica cretica]|uniref:Uncharacterized protein n=1 Tax=Brassica cretica TaxID=69181 RepID=A0A8S9PBI5_BRACR|nr:hypothetical protein F2Q69_00005954 [Brassica cretica]